MFFKILFSEGRKKILHRLFKCILYIQKIIYRKKSSAPDISIKIPFIYRCVSMNNLQFNRKKNLFY